TLQARGQATRFFPVGMLMPGRRFAGCVPRATHGNGFGRVSAPSAGVSGEACTSSKKERSRFHCGVWRGGRRVWVTFPGLERRTRAMRGDQLQRYLKKNVTRRVSLTLDDDRRDVVKTQDARADEIGLTLHGSFLDAPHKVLRALVRFLRRPEPHLRRRVVRLY